MREKEKNPMGKNTGKKTERREGKEEENKNNNNNATRERKQKVERQELRKENR